jgi:hypothetical protein
VPAARFFRFSEHVADPDSELLLFVDLKVISPMFEFPLAAAQFVVQRFHKPQ